MPCPAEGCDCLLTPEQLRSPAQKESNDVSHDPDDATLCACGHAALDHTGLPAGDESETVALSPPHPSPKSIPSVGHPPSYFQRLRTALSIPFSLTCGSSDIGPEDDAKFRRKLIDYYECQAPNQKLHCMALALPYSATEVIPTKIWRGGVGAPTLESFGLRRADASNPRNGLLVLRGVKEAFDNYEVCLVANPLKASQHALSIKVLNPDLLPQLIRGSSSHRFKDIAGKLLRLPVDRTPYLRLLSWHARIGHQAAVQRGWITQDVLTGFNEYFDWADTASPRHGTFNTPHWEPFTRASSFMQG